MQGRQRRFPSRFFEGAPSGFRGAEVIDTDRVLNEVANLLERKRRAQQDDVQNVLEELQGRISYPSLSVPHCTRILRSVVKKFWKEAVYLWQFMQQSGVKTNSRGCGYTAEAFIRGLSWASSLVVIEGMHHERLMLDNVAHGALLEINGKRLLWQVALAQFLEEGPQTVAGTGRTFNALASAGQLAHMRQLKKLLREDRRYDAYVNVAKAFTHAQGWQDSLDLTQDLRDAALPLKLDQLEQVMAASSAAARWREACFLIGQLHGMGVDFSVRLLTAALGACSRAGRLDEVHYFLMFMRRRGYWPSERTFNMALLGFCRKGKWLLATALLREMRNSFRDPDIISYTTCISAMKQASAWEPSMVMLLQLAANGLQTNEIALSAAMKACEKGLEWKLPLHCLTNSEQFGVKLDIVACSCAVGALHEGMRWKASCDLLEDTKQQNFHLDIIAHNVAASSLEKVSRWERALSYVNLATLQRLNANQASFGIVLGACANGGRSHRNSTLSQWRLAEKLNQQPDP